MRPLIIPKRTTDQCRDRALHRSRLAGTNKQICPDCSEVFQGPNAEERYKKHWKDKHAKKEINFVHM